MTDQKRTKSDLPEPFEGSLHSFDKLPKTLTVKGKLDLGLNNDLPKSLRIDTPLHLVGGFGMGKNFKRTRRLVPIFRKGDTPPEPPELNGFDRLSSTARDMIERVKSVISKNDNDMDSGSNTPGPKI